MKWHKLLLLKRGGIVNRNSDYKWLYKLVYTFSFSSLCRLWTECWKEKRGLGRDILPYCTFTHMQSITGCSWWNGDVRELQILSPPILSHWKGVSTSPTTVSDEAYCSFYRFLNICINFFTYLDDKLICSNSSCYPSDLSSVSLNLGVDPAAPPGVCRGFSSPQHLPHVGRCEQLLPASQQRHSHHL